MVVSVVACGESAKEWHKVPFDISVGVNDCVKFGCEVDYLICVNAPFKFEPTKKNDYINRLETIVNSKPKKFITSLCTEWKKYRGELQCREMHCIKLNRFGKYLNKGIVYHSKTSPFIAMSYAFNLGAKDIILWGVDFVNHKDFKPGQRGTDFEIEEYARFAGLLKDQGCNVWLGNNETSLSKYFKVWKG